VTELTAYELDGAIEQLTDRFYDELDMKHSANQIARVTISAIHSNNDTVWCDVYVDCISIARLIVTVHGKHQLWLRPPDRVKSAFTSRGVEW
jgi:hypothetical protein